MWDATCFHMVYKYYSIYFNLIILHFLFIIYNNAFVCPCTLNYLCVFWLYVCLSVCLSVYLSIYISIYLSIYLSIFLSFFLSFFLSIYLLISLLHVSMWEEWCFRNKWWLVLTIFSFIVLVFWWLCPLLRWRPHTIRYSCHCCSHCMCSLSAICIFCRLQRTFWGRGIRSMYVVVIT